MLNFPRKHNCGCVYKHVDLQTRYVKNIFISGLFALSGLLNSPSGFSAEIPTLLGKASTGQPQATATARILHLEQQVRQVRPENYNLKRYPVIDIQTKHWRNLLWTTAVVEPQEPYVAQALNGILALTTRSKLSKWQTQTINMAMQVGTQLYLSNPNVYASVEQQFLQTIKRSHNSEWVAMALSGLAKRKIAPDKLRQLSAHIRQRFPDWSQDMFLQTTLKEVAHSLAPSRVPPLKDLLKRTIASRQLHLYVICQPDRRVLCQAVLKNRNGQFVRQHGRLWSVPLLSQSIHGLGWNFVRGQTPQGIYRIEGIVPPSGNKFFRAYGQFSLVKLFLPFESGVREFLPRRKGRFKGSIQAYLALLPPSWRHYLPIQQSYWAGKMGRSLIRIHGSGDAPDFFSKKISYLDSYNWNPTIGCLSTLELYDKAGKLQQADMPKLLKALNEVGGKNFAGYMVVVEIPSSSKVPISVAEIEAILQKK
jgi:hypothetical protein